MFENQNAYNKSMDVRAKQPFFKTCAVTFGLSVAGFAPRHLNRSAEFLFSDNNMLKAK